MRNVVALLLLGLLAYAGYSFWKDPDAFRQKVAGIFGGTGQPEPASVPAGKAPDAATVPQPEPDRAAIAINDLADFAGRNTDNILLPLTLSAADVGTTPLQELKVRLNAEFSRAAVPAARARLHTALQLESVMEQAIAQRADYVKRRKAAEFHSTPIPGAPKAKISEAEISGRKKDAEFFMKSTDRKWDELAAQYRATIHRLVQSLRA